MWWSRRHLLVAAAGLSACGFTPVYAPSGGGSALDGAVLLETPSSRYGFVLRQHLQDRLGPPQTPRYRLTVTVRTSEDRVGVTREQSTSRFNVLGRATYRLEDLNGMQIASGTVDSFTSYGATGTPVATRSAQRDAYRRLMIILGDSIVERLILSVPAGGS